MDPKTFRRLIAQLAAQSELGALLQGLVTSEGGKLSVLMPSEGAQAGAEEVRQLLESLMEDPATAEKVREILDSAGGSDLVAHVVAVIVSGGPQDDDGAVQRVREPRTLRESIEGEWPW